MLSVHAIFCQVGLGGGEQVLALAGALGGQVRVAAGHHRGAEDQ